MKKLIDIIRRAFTLSEAEKKRIISVVEQGEDTFSEEFKIELGNILNQEIDFLMSKMESLDSQEEAVRKERQDSLTAAKPKLLQLVKEYKKVSASILNKFSADLENVGTRFEKEVEKTVHEKVEGSEIDALHQFLKQPKS